MPALQHGLGQLAAISFTAAVTDGFGLVGAGKMSRVTVDPSTFLAQAR